MRCVSVDELDLTASAELAELRSLTAQLQGGSEPSAIEVERALERGFGALVSLEARLQKTESPRDRRETEDQIASLREALLDVRRATHTTLPRGFVFAQRTRRRPIK